LTSRFAPAVGASLAGFMLGVYPGEQLRLSVAIYVLSQAAEVTYNLAEDQGWIWGKKGSAWEKPWWFGSWMFMPLASGQLLHAFVFDRECFPEVFAATWKPVRIVLILLGIWRFHLEILAAVYSGETRGLSLSPTLARDL
jgi:hypothetical protein